MDIFSAYEVSDDAVNKGIWADLFLMGDKIGAIRVRPSDTDLNKDYRKALADVGVDMVKLRKEKGEISDESQRAMMIAVASKTLLTDWELYETKDGKEVPIKFTEKKAVELMTRLPKLLKAVEDAAKRWTDFRKENHKEAVKV